MTAMRLHCALLSLASVATTASVVFSCGPPLARILQRPAEKRIAANRARRIRRSARTAPPRNAALSPISDAAPTALTATSAPTVMPPAVSRRGRADAAFERRRSWRPARRRRCRARIGGRGALGRLIAELAIGRVAAPVLVPAGQEIEQDGARHDRHARLAHGKAAADLAQVSLHAGGGVQSEGRAARQHDGVDAFHGLRRVEQGGLARAGSAAAHVDARHHRLRRTPPRWSPSRARRRRHGRRARPISVIRLRLP